MSYHANSNILINNHLAFVTYSTAMAVNEMVDKISGAIGYRPKYYSICIFIDLSKAFDTLDHNISLGRVRVRFKLEYYGIRGTALKACGVPQSSILGPMFFLIYINDIANISDILQLILFADDRLLIYLRFLTTDLHGSISKS